MARVIFAIDDDPLMLEVLAAILLPPTYHTVSARDGQGALDTVFRIPPDLVLLDLELPDCPGMSVLESLRRRPGWSKVPIVMLTANNAIEPILKARSLGARGYLCKPIAPAEFGGVIRDLLAEPDVVWLDDITRLRTVRGSDYAGLSHPHSG
ncbi:response regulator [Caulobacter sp. SLTY]|uniref:response regulator n=1 Tax=Caulobacter sp. SLTY TaxID=2683262 RepID=UPI003211CAE2